MPYTLTSVGTFLARAKRRNRLVVSTALITPSRYAEGYERWSASLEEEHPRLAAQGKRVVGLVAVPGALLVVPPSWVKRLPLRSKVRLESIISGVEDEDLAHGVGEIQVPPYTPIPFTGTFPPPAKTALYTDLQEKLDWWSKQLPDSEDIQAGVRWYPRNELVILARPGKPKRPRLMRTVYRQSSTIRLANDYARPHSSEDYMYRIPEEVFQVFARDAKDFDRNFAIFSMRRDHLLSIVHIRSKLVVGAVMAAPYANARVDKFLNRSIPG